MNTDLAKVIAQLNKKFGEGTVVLGEAIRDDIISRTTSGSLALDVILGGGWPTNQWHEIVGEASNGKTALALKTVAANQAKNRSLASCVAGPQIPSTATPRFF